MKKKKIAYWIATGVTLAPYFLRKRYDRAAAVA